MRVFSTNGAPTSDKKGRRNRSFLHSTRKKAAFRSKNRLSLRVHPLFFLVGVWYSCTGELFLFLISCLVAVQHELAHAFAAAKLGYQLNNIVLMPFGAIIDGDLHGLSLKDEIFVAFFGPLCNLLTAVFFVAVWWFAPTMYAFTDVAVTSSLAIALVNLLPAYPLDGGRILKCSLTRIFAKSTADLSAAEEKSKKVCRFITFFFAAALLLLFLIQCSRATPNPTLLLFALFLLFGALGSRDKTAVYARINFAQPSPLKKGVEIRRVAILDSCPIKDAFRFLAKGCYLILEVYDDKERRIAEISQNTLSALFAAAPSPYTSIKELL